VVDYSTPLQRLEILMSRPKRFLVTPFVILVTLLSLGLPVIQFHVQAKATPIDCSAAVTPASAASPVATPAPVHEASPTAIAFPSGGGEVTVFAASSLTDSFGQIKTTLEAANPGLTITYNFAGSQALVTQLTQGASADVFASASNSQMKAAVDGGVIDGTPVTFTQNRLAIIVPNDNPAGVTGFADLGKDGLKLVLAQAEVPVGMYARQSICKAASDTATYGNSFVDSVTANIVSEEDNVKAVASKVALGEADAGIVYTTDVTADVADSVQVIAIPADVNVVAKYPIAPVTGGNADLADAFISYLTGPEGQAILQSYGFEPTS
jgi:molybdate transport system substrate-binding protein